MVYGVDDSDDSIFPPEAEKDSLEKLAHAIAIPKAQHLHEDNHLMFEVLMPHPDSQQNLEFLDQREEPYHPKVESSI